MVLLALASFRVIAVHTCRLQLEVVVIVNPFLQIRLATAAVVIQTCLLHQTGSNYCFQKQIIINQMSRLNFQRVSYLIFNYYY